MIVIKNNLKPKITSIDHVLLFLTYRCNLHCSFYLSSNRYWQADNELSLTSAVEPKIFLLPKRRHKEMSTKDIVERVIPQCEKSNVKIITLSGEKLW